MVFIHGQLVSEMFKSADIKLANINIKTYRHLTSISMFIILHCVQNLWRINLPIVCLSIFHNIKLV